MRHRAGAQLPRRPDARPEGADRRRHGVKAPAAVDRSRSREHVAWLLHHSTDAALLTDAHGVIQYVNPAFEAMTGFDRQDALGRTPSILKSGLQSPAFYRRLWHTVRAGREFAAVFVNRRKDGSHFHLEMLIRPLFDDSGRISHFLASGRDVTERIAAEERLQRAATHDALTGVPNRAVFAERLASLMQGARREGDRFTAVLVDVNRFKLVNDQQGHAAGDAVLREVAQRLLHAVRDGDTVARLGGDEFGLLLAGTGVPASVEQALRKLADAFGPPVVLPDGRSIPVTVSIGACIRPVGEHDEQQVLACADAAMYRAKRGDGTGYCLHDTDTVALQPVPSSPLPLPPLSASLPRGPDALLDQLQGRIAVRRHTLEAGHTIHHAGQPFTSLFLLGDGSATLTRPAADGHAERVEVRSRGDWLGLDGIATGRHAWHARAAGPGEVLSVDFAAVLRLARDEPPLALLLMEAMARQLARSGALETDDLPAAAPESG